MSFAKFIPIEIKEENDRLESDYNRIFEASCPLEAKPDDQIASK